MKKIHFLKLKLIRPSKLFLGMPLAIFSLEVYLGMLLGYLLTKFFAGTEPGFPGKVRSVIFHVGSYRLHLYHWLLGCVILISALSLKFYPFYPQFSYGFLGGIIFQGVSCYPDWHRILVRAKR